uniref:Wound-induced protein 1 n=1 Tax=Aegilops tauschii subsp. strangulata TaxID=200361 RepID=A0A453I9N8_AEGTS
MMRLLTGAGTNAEFRFSPRSVDAFGSTVIAEGSADGAGQLLYWVHAWTVGPDGVITQLREYFNTDLTVTRLSAAAATNNASAGSPIGPLLAGAHAQVAQVPVAEPPQRPRAQVAAGPRPRHL